MMQIIQRRLISVYALLNLIKGYNVLRKADKNPKYWMQSQNKSIARFVKYVYEIPFYKKKFDNAGIKPEDIRTREDFAKLPILTKQEYRDWLLQETRNKKRFSGWMYRQTTGSSGTPLDLYSLPTDRAAEIANLMRCAIYQKKGYNPFFDRVFSTMTPKPAVQKRFSIPYNGKMSSISTPKELVEGYNAARPDFYYGNKSAVLAIAKYSLDNKIKLHPTKCVGSISETLNDNARNIISKAFGPAKLFDIYGCAETGNFAVDCPSSPNKHVIWHDTHVVRLFNEEKISDNVYRGQLLITSLVHKGFPLINYLVGDTIELTIEDGVPYITQIFGRTNDIIRNADGSNFQWMHINRIMFGITDILQFRIIQKSFDKLVFVLAADPKMSIERKAEIQSLIQDRAIDLFGRDYATTGKEISFEWCNRIAPDPNGKVRVLISEVEQ